MGEVGGGAVLRGRDKKRRRKRRGRYIQFFPAVVREACDHGRMVRQV